MHFLVDHPCNNGKNHRTQGDCRAKAPIHIADYLQVSSGAGKGGAGGGSRPSNDSVVDFYIRPNSMRKGRGGEGVEIFKLLFAWYVLVGHHRKL